MFSPDLGYLLTLFWSYVQTTEIYFTLINIHYFIYLKKIVLYNNIYLIENCRQKNPKLLIITDIEVHVC